jgi:histone-lysine N-methyltransferase SETD1
LTFTKKNRPASTPKPKVVSPKVVKKVQRRALSYSSSESSDEDEVVRPVKGNKERIKSPSLTPEVEAAIPPPMEIETIVKTTTPVKLEVEVKTTEVVDEVDDTPVVKAGKKRANKGKSEAKKKKARITSPVLDVTVPAPAEPELAEIQLDEKVEATPVRPVKAAKPKKAPKTEAERFIENGIVVDEEDAYWLGQALAAAEGVEPEMSDDEEDFLLDEKHPLYHQSGSWRAEGVKKIPQTSKSEYLPQRNRAVVATEDNIALASGRTARVTGRRLAHDMESTRKTAAAATAESDLFAFNQLRIRKKQLQFARSPIEGYGLYAMETIQPGEMVCEYVGEICRSAVAEIREQRYLKQGIGSSYLFRIDADVVCDATFRGSVR